MTKSRIEYKKRITKAVDELPPSRLSSVLDFIEYLKDREAWKESREILSNKALVSHLKEADRDWKEGDYAEGSYIEWKKVNV